jgi:hypothetical protein
MTPLDVAAAIPDAPPPVTLQPGGIASPAGEAAVLSLTDIVWRAPGIRRWLHSLPPLRFPDLGGRGFRMPRRATLLRPWRMLPALRVLMRAVPRLLAGVLANSARIAFRALLRGFGWVREQIGTGILDALDSLRAPADPIRRIEAGHDPCPDHRSVAVFVQFSQDGTISDMVRRQMEAYRELGFATLLVSNSPAFPEESWQAARRVAALVVHRRNRGLDFGAWKDLVPVALERWPATEELLMVNDSILGPIRPLGPVIDAMRRAGPGFYGMLESLQGGPHLQSWFTLARGRQAVADLADFLGRLRLSRSKWKIIQRGELRLARHMLRRGHRVAAAFGYARLVETALAAPAERAYLERAIPLWVRGADTAAARDALLARPVNPAHHLWRALSGPAGCPFIKTELVRRNPGGLPDVGSWPDLVPGDGPCTTEMLRAHLAALGP